MAINWGEIEDKYGGTKYAKEGVYVTKVKEVKFHPVGQNGSIAQDFIFKDGKDGAYPKARHWLSFKNDNWRAWHQRCLLVALGQLEDKAKEIVEYCEKQEGNEAITEAYQKAYNKAIKSPSAIDVEIEVFADGRYMNADITNREVRMNYPEVKEEKEDNPFSDAEEAEDIKDSDLPF